MTEKKRKKSVGAGQKRGVYEIERGFRVAGVAVCRGERGDYDHRPR